MISGSDDGMIFIWHKETEEIVQLLKGDMYVVNVVQGHPSGMPILATSGIENDVKIWTPTAAKPLTDDVLMEKIKKVVRWSNLL